MAKIIKVEIKNYRGVLNFNEFTDSDFICLIGRGDSGKSTILEAISAALSPSWNLTFYDTDFHKCNTDIPIEISLTLTEIPPALLEEERKFGRYIRFYKREGRDLRDELADGYEEALTVKLSVDRALEPKWVVTNAREQEDKAISATDRAKLNCFIISDYVDRHFSWNKGNPLYSILRSQDAAGEEEGRNVVLEAVRVAKDRIDQGDFETFEKIESEIKTNAAAFGLNLAEPHTTIDFRDLSIREGRVCLHDDNIPFRLKGKGSKRVASMAVQSVLAEKGGIMLVDEIEQGLEPDRIRLLARTLKEENAGQIFVTTHSRDVVTELESTDLIIIHKDKETHELKMSRLDYEKDRLQGAVRSCPEAFFASKVIVCEGTTEVGICRALDRYRKAIGKPLMAFADAAYVDGTGSEFVSRARMMREARIQVAMLGDSDEEGFNNKKAELRGEGILIFDCDDDLAIEDQVFSDLPWQALLDLVDYAGTAHSKSTDEITDLIARNYEGEADFPVATWRDEETPAIRKAIGKASRWKKKPWFKRIDHGEQMGEIIFDHFDDMSDEKRLKVTLSGLSNWIDGVI